MNTEFVRDIGQAVICLAIVIIAGYTQIVQGHIPSPWDTLLLVALGLMGLGDGVRLVVKRARSL